MKSRLIAFLLVLVSVANAELKLNGMFTDNMVLQRNQQVPVWGTADPGSKVTVDFAGQKKTVVAGACGEWQVMLEPMKANAVPELLLAESSIGNQQSSIENVLVGDVWLCTGQSNMAQTMKRYLIWDQIKDDLSNDQIRFFKMKEGGIGSPEPTKELVIDPFFNNSWQTCSPEFAAEFSATAGFFAMKLQQEIGVPIGLLYAVRGGTRANMWMPREALESKPIYERYLDASNGEWKPAKNNPGALRAPSNLYNGTIHPLAPFAIRGAIWYQGESDSSESEIYTEMMGDLIAAWRAEWGYEFPFLFVQLAPYSNVNWDQLGEGWAWQREAQFQCLEAVPNTGMAVIIDGGEAKDIHPQAKNLPGERLALIAATLDKDLNADFPSIGNLTIKKSKALVQFNGVSGGLKTQRVAMNVERGHPAGEGPNAVVAEADELKGFTICGADRAFVAAQAKIVSKDSVLVWSPDVKVPVAVRYGWANFPLCNLYGGNGMPASPFRTDDFPMPNLTGEKLGEPFGGVRPEWGAAMEALNAGDGLFETSEVADVSAMKATGSYLYFRSTHLIEPSAAVVQLIYFDEGFATIQLRYDSSDAELFSGTTPGVWKPAGEVNGQNSKQWKVVELELPDAQFSKRCNGGDIRLQTTGSLIVGGIYVQLEAE